MRYGIVMLFCLPFFSFGQEGDMLKKKTKKNAIVLTPLNSIDPVNPTFQFGYQRQIMEVWEAQVEVGLLMKKSPWDEFIEGWSTVDDSLNVHSLDDSLKTHHEGFRLRAELRYYLKQDKVVNHYVSFELFFLKNNTSTTEHFVTSGGLGYSEYFINKKNKYGVNVKYGLKFLEKSGFFFEVYGGIGLSFRQIKHEERDNLNDELDGYDLWDNNKIKGNSFVLNLPFNGKVGFQF